jgi:tRNA pseudouridine synthase 10
LGGAGECYICGGLTSKIDAVLELVARTAKPYDFVTFSVGLSVPQDTQEREDRLRAEFKVRGHETLKAQLAKIITDEFAALSKKKPEKLRPDLSVLVDLIEFRVHVSSKPLFVYGRYTKPAGISQRRQRCDKCGGTGCGHCQNTGYTSDQSVEAVLARRLGKIFGSEKTKFTWFGSEDPDSRVLGSGRPFITEVKSPKRRTGPVGFLGRTKAGQVRVGGLRTLSGKPTRLPSFRTQARVFATSDEPPAKEWTERIESEMTNRLVEFRGPRKSVSRKIHSVQVVSTKGELVIDIEIDGGLPIKRLIDGESVNPSISEILKTQLRCRRFDITRIVEQGGFEFGKI